MLLIIQHTYYRRKGNCETILHVSFVIAFPIYMYSALKIFDTVRIMTVELFLLNAASDNQKQTITFLYQLVRGMAARSYGLNVARLAGIHQDIIQGAELLSSQLEERIQKRRFVPQNTIQDIMVLLIFVGINVSSS